MASSPYASPISTATKRASQRKSRSHQGKDLVTRYSALIQKPETRNQKQETDAFSLLLSDFWFLVSSNLLRLILPEQAGRPEQQDRDQDDEGDDIAIVRELAAADERFDDADDQSAHHRAGHDTDAAEHRGDERFQSGHDPHQRIDLRIQKAVEDAGHRGEHGADDERRRDHAIGRDAIIEAVSKLNDTARIARPNFVP